MSKVKIMKEKATIDQKKQKSELRKNINSDFLDSKNKKNEYSENEKKLQARYKELTGENFDLSTLVISSKDANKVRLLFWWENNFLKRFKNHQSIKSEFKQVSPAALEKFASSYDHTQPQLKPKSTRDYKKLRVNTIKTMQKQEKEQIFAEKNPLIVEVFQQIYDNKWKKSIQPNSKKNIIDLHDVCKYFVNGTNVEYILKKININIKSGEIFVILGASGSGKTTLLNIISGLMEASSGDVIVQNKNLFLMDERNKIKFRADNISFVFQSYNLIPSLTVEENIKVGASLRPRNTEKISLKDIMKLLNLYEQKNKYPFQLSGGQNQRVSIGRALAKNPKILFADEPTGALDEERGKEALKFLVDINEKYGTTIIMVTHNPNFRWIGDSTLRIHDGEVETLTHNKKRIKPEDINWA